ncbi:MULTISPECIES: alpha/beta fold hydrolase [unclassified Streptomyces]|uniref:thioesterase II family protein n=1 Tax=unclassified Streptomyces TaxID=2593676 RepID=UPI002365B21F|nr:MULTISPECIES: alpha/beta fold hydrolase [unclassified Streptomyces]MDF3142971.1 alpha/beta fold hydrolase [Streptomyces sp. T21Q-yed]WDF42877.1 alpha/beta fold hydrolase [Streptomyces sp. T12]
MTRWTVRRHRRPDAVTSLYCFPHAGGSPGEYVRWSDDLPEVQVWGVHLPGRTTRLTEPPFTDVASLVDDLLSVVSFGRPFVFFGHSLGALVAFETAKELSRRGRAQPDALIVSSCPAPPLPPIREPVHLLPDDELIDEIERRWDEPLDHLRHDPGLRAPALACLRADFTLLNNYRPTSDRRLDCPVTVLAGTREPWTPTAADWAAHTRGPTDVRLLPGGHFYFRESRSAALRAVRETVLTTTLR